MAVKQWYDQNIGGLSQLETRYRSETQRQTEGFRPSMTHGWATQPRWERIAAMVRRTWGQYSNLSPSPTHLSHTTSINPFENKVWEIYFYKDVYSFVHWSSYIMFDYVSADICITAIQHRSRLKLICFDQIRKNPTTWFNGPNSTTRLFRILKFSGLSFPVTTSSSNSILSNGRPAPFAVWGFI